MQKELKLQIRGLIAAAVLLTIMILSAASQTDSFKITSINPIDAGIVYTKFNETDSLDFLILHRVRTGIHGNTLTMNELAFYENLRVAAGKRQFTKWLHELIVRENIRENLPVTEASPQAAEKQFEAFEGKIIREIKFSSVNLFAPSIDDPNYNKDGKLERIGNYLHFNTSSRILRNNLLFKPGDRIDPFLLGDTERLLRQLSYLEDARIYLFEDLHNPEYVDIIVVTKDRWSRGFDIDLSEIDEGRIELYDRNLLGLGQEVKTNLYFDGSENQAFGYKAGLNVSNIGGNLIKSGISYFNAFNNKRFHIITGRDFLSPSIKYAGGFKFTSANFFDDFYFPDTTFLNQGINFHDYDYWLGRSFLLKGKENYQRNNLYLTSRYNRSIFFERPEIDENNRYIFHNRNLYLAGLAFTRLAYLKSTYIFGFGPTEDIPVGIKIETIAGYESSQFFSRMYAGFNISAANYFDNFAYINSSIAAGGFFNKGNREQGLLKIETSGFSNPVYIGDYFLRQFFSVNFTKGIKRFDDEFVSISNNYGIRGLKSNMLEGTQKLSLQLESMFYARKHWYGFKYAFYSMVDLGWIGQGGKMVIQEDFYSGLGLGIRVRNEHLVLPTLQIRFAWFPKIPESASTRFIYILSEQRMRSDDFSITAPDILPFR